MWILHDDGCVNINTIVSIELDILCNQITYTTINGSYYRVQYKDLEEAKKGYEKIVEIVRSDNDKNAD
jgi:hypothetical protein